MISKKNLTVIIVSFFSDEVIFDCISSIDEEIEIIVIENSRNFKLKDELEKKFKNVKCFIHENKGMGAGNNFGISKINSDFAFILNPDVILEKDTIHKIIEQSKKIDSFSILTPIHDNIKYPNYKIRSQNLEKESFDLINVDSVDGFSMLLNLNRISKILNINDSKFVFKCRRICQSRDRPCNYVCRRHRSSYRDTDQKNQFKQRRLYL